MTNIHAALEIGTTRTVLAIGESRNGQRLRVTCHAEIASTGVRKSQILDIAQATASVRSVLRDIEKKQRAHGDTIDIGNVFLVISGDHVKADPYQGTAQVAGSKVGVEDLEEVRQSSRLMSLPRDRELLDIVDQCYGLDAIEGIASPRGMSGRVLKLNTLQVHADTNRINDARTAAGNARLEVRDPLFAATCAAEAVLSGNDKRSGTLVIDFGGGSTGYAVYSDGYLVAANVIGVGGDHITNDIAYAFQTTQGQAEDLKRREACAIVGGERGSSARVQFAGTSALMKARAVSRHALDTVVNLRCKEILSIIRNDLEDQDLLHLLNAGVVITGGGAALRGLDALIVRELGLPVRIGLPTEVDGLEEADAPESFASIAGALLYAHRNYERKPFFSSILKGLFKR